MILVMDIVGSNCESNYKKIDQSHCMVDKLEYQTAKTNNTKFFAQTRLIESTNVP